ncbi:DUF374 domain-containing protein [Candidatus Babeliales bacterium]|nr:DUF374 domain-containing protein [Candidatus Babeliales bacterium]
MSPKTLIKSLKSIHLINLLISSFLYGIIRLLFATYKLKLTYDKNFIKPMKKQHGIFYFWHQNIVGCMYFFFKKKSQGYCVASPSDDGKIAGFICQKLGFNVIYGSSQKNCIRLIRLTLAALNEHKQVCMIGDGSRGPALKLQRGLTYLAKKSTAPLIFVECTASKAITLKKSWDLFQIPLPFSTITIHVNAPVAR